MAWGVTVGPCMHRAGNLLGKHPAFRHGMGAVNDGLIEIGPAWDFGAEWMCQVYLYFAHGKNLLFLFI